MLKKILMFIGEKIGNAITLLISSKILFRVYNYVYEHSPYRIIRVLVRFVDLPDKDNSWMIYLLNKKKVITTIKKGDLLSKQFALSYKWHNPAINYTENLLNTYYTKDIPWIDVGSNLGLRSLLALSENRKVYFLEPNAALNQINLERCIQNGFRDFTFFECGASDKKGEIEFYIDDTTYNSSIELQSLERNQIVKTEKIKIDTLDNLFSDKIHNYSTACIKIDVEGHELHVIDGALQMIKEVFPTMVVEVNTKGKYLSEFIKIMTKFDYQVFAIDNFGSGKYFKLLGNTDLTILDAIASNDFLIIHDEKLIQLVKEGSI